jgi:ketosteroid isomerase-like protein
MTITEADKKTIKNEVKHKFDQLISAINQSNAEAWSENYSQSQFLSAIASTDLFVARSVWVATITNYFSMREHQRLEPYEVQITALTPDLALLTSQENGEIRLKDGGELKHKHVFTMIWKKEQDGWKILHSHESWAEE